MTNNKFIVSQKVTGAERKVIASVIAEAIGDQSKYAGMPSMAYNIGEWRVEKTGIVRSPEVDIADIEKIKPVIEALKSSGFTVEGDLSIILSAEAHTGGTLRNLFNLISSKGLLLQKALSRQNGATQAELVQTINEVPIETIENFIRVYNNGLEVGRYINSGNILLEHLPYEIGFCFFNATLDTDKIFAYTTLAIKINEIALSLKHTNFKQNQTENEAYTMRCFLLRLGFIGDKYKSSRKILLSKLEGNKAHKIVNSVVI